MNRLFGSNNKTPKPTLNDAIGKTDERIAGVEAKVKKLDAELTKFRDQMKKMAPGPGRSAVQKRAMTVLRQKKLYESQLDNMRQQTYNMETAIMTTENLKNTMATVDAMKTANKELKKQYGKMDIDKIEQVHDEMQDLIEQANEIQESMNMSYGVPDDIDEAELDAELEALEDEIPDEEDEIPSYLREDTTEDLPDIESVAPEAKAEPKKRIDEGVV